MAHIWRTGFDVHVGEPIAPDDRRTLEHVARYLLRAPVSLERLCRIIWARLIAKVYLEDPLLCPECGPGMQILSFITDPPVIDQILRHLKWRPGEAFLPNGRSPPAELKVAESLPSVQFPRNA